MREELFVARELGSDERRDPAEDFFLPHQQHLGGKEDENTRKHRLTRSANAPGVDVRGGRRWIVRRLRGRRDRTPTDAIRGRTVRLG